MDEHTSGDRDISHRIHGHRNAYQSAAAVRYRRQHLHYLAGFRHCTPRGRPFIGVDPVVIKVVRENDNVCLDCSNRNQNASSAKPFRPQPVIHMFHNFCLSYVLPRVRNDVGRHNNRGVTYSRPNSGTGMPSTERFQARPSGRASKAVR